MSSSHQKLSGKSLVRVGESLYRSPSSGTYFAYFWQNGKQFKRSLQTKDQAHARRKLKDLKERVRHTHGKDDRITLAQLLERYEKSQRHLAPSSLTRLSGIVRRLHAEWPGGTSVKVSSILPSTVREWLGNQGSRVSKATYNEYVRFIKGLFSLAIEDGVIFESPASEIRPVKRDSPNRRTPNFEQFRQIVAEIRGQTRNRRNDQSGDFVEFLGLSGLGNGEAAALRRSDIDWDRKEMTVKRLKTGRIFRVPIFPQLEPLLKNLFESASPDPNALIFNISNAKKSLVGACSRLNLPYFSHRAFRRMFITRALEKGIDVKVIADWQGHSDGGKLILDTYSHVRRPHSEAMARLLSSED